MPWGTWQSRRSNDTQCLSSTQSMCVGSFLLVWIFPRCWSSAHSADKCTLMIFLRELAHAVALSRTTHTCGIPLRLAPSPTPRKEAKVAAITSSTATSARCRGLTPSKTRLGTSKQREAPAPEGTNEIARPLSPALYGTAQPRGCPASLWASPIQQMVALTDIRHSRCRPEVDHPPEMSLAPLQLIANVREKDGSRLEQ